MEENMTYKVTLSDGTEIDNLRLNGNNYISNEPLTEEDFEGKLEEVTITGPMGTQTMEHCELVQLQQYGDEYWFIIRQIPADELARRQARADIDYIAFMTDVELEV